MGLPVVSIVSDASHYRPYLCSICLDMVPLHDAVVSKCSHPFCRRCLESQFSATLALSSVSSGGSEDSNSTTRTRLGCPSCALDLSNSQTSELAADGRPNWTQVVKGVDAYRLEEAQPLAHTVLGQVKVNCAHCKEWTGPYAELASHRSECKGPKSKVPLRSLSASDDDLPSDGPMRRLHRRRNSREPALDVSEHEPYRVKLQALRRASGERSETSSSMQKDISAAASLEEFPSSLHSVQKQGQRGADDTEVSVLSSSVIMSSNDLMPGQLNKGKLQQTSSHPQVCAAANTLKEQANACFNKQDHVEARKLYSEGIQRMRILDPMTSVEERQLVATLYCNRSATFLKDRNFESCIDDCNTALQYYPEYSKAFTRKWRALVALGRVEEAKASTQAAMEKCGTADPNKGPPLVHKDEMGRTLELERNVQMARDLLQQKDYRGAKQLTDQLLKTSECPTFSFLAARADAAAIGAVESAMERCQVSLRTLSGGSKASGGKSLDGMHAKAFVAFMAGQMERAKEYYNEALKIDPNDEDVKTNYRLCRKIGKIHTDAREAMGLDQFAKAVEILTFGISEKLPKRAPVNSLLYADRAEAHLKSRSFREALNDARVAIESKNDNVPAWVTKTSAYIAMKRGKDARSELLTVKRSWGNRNESIKEAFRRADVEARISEQDAELRAIVAQSPVKRGSEMDTNFAQFVPKRLVARRSSLNHGGQDYNAGSVEPRPGRRSSLNNGGQDYNAGSAELRPGRRSSLTGASDAGNSSSTPTRGKPRRRGSVGGGSTALGVSSNHESKRNGSAQPKPIRRISSSTAPLAQQQQKQQQQQHEKGMRRMVNSNSELNSPKRSSDSHSPTPNAAWNDAGASGKGKTMTHDDMRRRMSMI